MSADGILKKLGHYYKHVAGGVSVICRSMDLKLLKDKKLEINVVYENKVKNGMKQ